VPAFQVRVFRKDGGYLAWIDGIGTVEGRTLAETRREARKFIRTVLGGAFPDRPSIDPAGAEEVLQFVVDVRLQRKRLTPPNNAQPASSLSRPRTAPETS
jgi:hypothetical protein